MKYLIGVVALLGLLSIEARAEGTKDKSDQSTPKKALKSFDQFGTEESLDRATIIYHAKTDDEKKIARSFATVDLELAKLRQAAVARFNREAGDAVIHAARDVTSEDVDAATETITGDKAILIGKHFGEPLQMIRVNGAWKVSLADTLARSPAAASDLAEVCEAVVKALKLTEQELAADKYANASLLERAVKRRVRAVLGPE